jgi:hypothetical protein
VFDKQSRLESLDSGPTDPSFVAQQKAHFCSGRQTTLTSSKEKLA